MEKIFDLLMRHESHAQDSIRLVANENLPDVEERLPYLMDMFARYSFEKDAPWKVQSYCLDEIESNTEAMLKELLNCKYVSLKPISGLNGMITVISAFNKAGDTVMTLDPLDGGHGETGEILKRLGMNSVYIPFDRNTWQIDVNKLSKVIDTHKVKMIYLDLCMVLFPQPIRQIKELVSDKVLIVYDASHVLGLIIGGQFQQPLEEGADIIIANTHKTLPGPHKAVFATNKRLLKYLFVQESRHYISHHHMADVACLGLVLERGASYFKEYACQVIRNARTLAAELYQRGVKVQLPNLQFTSSHQFWIDCGEKNDVDEVVELLNQLNLIVNSTLIPSMNMRWGIRIGVQEITKQQITPEGIKIIAEIISHVILNRKIDDTVLNKKKYLINHCFNNRPDPERLKNIIEIIRQKPL